MPVADSLSVSAPVGETNVEYFLSCPTGVVEYYFDSPALLWSDELYRIHGYERGDIVPTLDLGISHFEPADRAGARALWETLLSRGGPVSAYFSLRDVNGKVRKVLISGDYIRRDNTHTSSETHAGREPHTGSDPVGVWALVVDLTKAVYDDTKKTANEAVAASAVSRAVIEQAKGILMGLGGLTADKAFEHISQRSQDTNRKVIAVAQDIIDRAGQLNLTLQPRTRAEVLLDLVYPPTTKQIPPHYR